MQKIIFIICTVAYLCVCMFLPGCKARKTQKESSSYSDKSTLSSNKKTNSSFADTSHKSIENKVNTVDTGANDLEVQNDSGKLVKIDVAPDGSIHYTGSAKKVTVKSKHKKTDNSVKNIEIQKAVTSQQVTTTDKHEQKKVEAKTAIKNTESKMDTSTILEWIGVVLVIGVVVYLYIKGKFAPLTTIFKNLKK